MAVKRAETVPAMTILNPIPRKTAVLRWQAARARQEMILEAMKKNRNLVQI